MKPKINIRRDAKTLKGKAISSLKRGLTSFNSFNDDGRSTTVMLHLQHSCEMLLKAMLVQKGMNVFDPKSSMSFGFSKCANLAQSHCGLLIEEAGAMRAIDALRDSEQHWFIVISEEMLYLHARGLITVFDDVLKRSFKESLADHLPIRVLPLSTTPATDVEVLIDSEYSQISDLLRPGRRARDEARGRIRALLAMESHIVENVNVTERDINRVEQAIRKNVPIDRVFPRLLTLGTSATTGHGFDFKVHFSKKDGAPVRFISGDDPGEAAAVREIDLQKKFSVRPSLLAAKLKISPPKAKLLRAHLEIDTDPTCAHTFEFGTQKILCFSNNAERKMQNYLNEHSIEHLWTNRLKS